MKKLFILPLAMILLASCGGGSGDSKDLGAGWDEETKTQMTNSIGTVLPYMELSEVETSYVDNAFQIFAIGGQTEVTAYRALLEVNYNYLNTFPDSYGDSTLVFESKEESVAVRVELQTYVGVDESENEVNVFAAVAYKYTSWPTAALASLGISDAPVYAGNNKLTNFATSYLDGTPALQVYVFGGTAASYTTTLEAAGFTVGDYGDIDQDYAGEYYAYPETGDTSIDFYDNGQLGLVIIFSIYAGE